MLIEKNIHLHSSTLRRGIKRILCPTDLTPASDEALRYAIALAKTFHAKLYVCHAVENRSNPLHGQLLGLNHIKNLFSESVGQYISVADEPHLDWEGVVVEGEAAEMIARSAAERSVDLIVMRSRRRPLGAAILGSTAETICRTAPCPVLVTHPQEREWVSSIAGKINLKRLLVAYDLSDYSELALSYALSLAEEHQAELHLLHVLSPKLENSWYPLGENCFHKAARRLQYAIPADAYLWCEVKQVVREGQPYREILNYTEENNIDLICMGAHGRGFSKFALFGSNVDRILRQAKCPVFVARMLKPALVQAIAEKELSTSNL